MKNFYLTFLLIFGTFLQSQELPSTIFDTWYPLEILPSDGPPSAIVVEDITPAISPYLTINEDLTFTGMMACNEFSGNLVPHPNNEWYQTENLVSTELNCASQEQNDFELAFLAYLEYCSWNPQITSVENGLSLYMDTPVFGYGIFNNYRLSSQTFSANKLFKIYPNPVTDFIQLDTNKKIDKVEIHTVQGQKVKTLIEPSKAIDVRELQKGIYIIQLKINDNWVRMRFIKD